MKLKEKSKGFTLIEVIATISITAIILTIIGTTIINTITKSKNESIKISTKSLLNSARIYTKEYSEEISWTKEENYKFSCISINELINKDLLKKDFKKNYPNTKYVIIKKDENNNIISEEIDDGTCSASIKSITIPTPKEYCINNLKYTGFLQTITKSYENNDFIFKSDTDLTEKNYAIDVIDAGTYNITASLKDKNNSQWTDGTTTDKNFSCTIKKDTPTIRLDNNGISPENITLNEPINVKFTSNANGTLILKSSNNEYYKTSINDNKVIANTENNFNIKFLSTRNAEGTITITLIPEDQKNYNNSTTIYTIAKKQKQIAPIPTCKNSDYTGDYQPLIKFDDIDITKASDNGIKLYNYEEKEIGLYTVEAELKYGYIWEDNTIEPKTLNCEIIRPTFEVCYNANLDTETTECDRVLYEDEYTIKSNNFNNSNYTFTAWNTMSNGRGGTFNPNQSIKYDFLGDTTLYAQWSLNTYTINYHPNNKTEEIIKDTIAPNKPINLMNDKIFKKYAPTINEGITPEYTLTNWSTNADGTGNSYTPGTIIDKQDIGEFIEKNLTNGEINLYAQWREPVYAIYNINIDSETIDGEKHQNYITNQNFEGYWDTLENAINHASSGYTIMALKNNSIQNITINKDLTLNTNNKTITITGNTGIINNNANLLINGNGLIESNVKTSTIQNTGSGNLTLNNIKLKNTWGNILFSNSSGATTLNYVTTSTINNSLLFEGTGIIAINNCTINSSQTGINQSQENPISINNTTITAPDGINVEGGNIEINNTTINASNIGIKNKNAKIIITENVTINASDENSYAIHNQNGTIEIGHKNIKIEGNTGIYNGINAKLYLLTEKQTEPNNICNSYIIANDSAINNTGKIYLGEQEKEYVLDEDEPYYTHTCLASKTSFVISNQTDAYVEYSAGIRTYSANENKSAETEIANYNDGTFTLKGGKVFYNQAEKETGFAEPKPLTRKGLICEKINLDQEAPALWYSNWVTETFYKKNTDGTNIVNPQKIIIGNHEFTYVKYSFLASWNPPIKSNIPCDSQTKEPTQSALTPSTDINSFKEEIIYETK